MREPVSLLLTAILALAQPGAGGAAGQAALVPPQGTDASPSPQTVLAEDSPAGKYDPKVQDQVCGVNSLFMLLRLLGRGAAYERVSELVVPGPKGNSLLELRDAAGRLGVELVVCKTDPGDVAAVHGRPSIALIREQARTVGDQKVLVRGHYVVIKPDAGKDAEGVLEVLDGTYGFLESVPDADFSEIWTGYYLAARDRLVDRLPWRALAAALVLLGLAYWWPRRKPLGRWLRRGSAPAGAMLLLCGTAAASLSTAAGAAEPADPGPADPSAAIWRSPERDAANALYLFAHLCGRECSYEDVLRVLPDVDRKSSLLDLRTAAQRLGVPAAIYRCPWADFEAMEEPVILFFEGSDARAGEFVLPVSRMRSGEMVYVAPGRAVVEHLSLDQFRRRWSGHLLRAQPREGPWGWIACAAAVALFGAWRFHWHGRRRLLQRGSHHEVRTEDALARGEPNRAGPDNTR